MKLRAEGFTEALLVVYGEIRHRIEAQKLLLVIKIDAVGAEDAGVLFRGGVDFLIIRLSRGIDGVEADGQENVELLQHGILDRLREAVQAASVHVGGDLRVNRADGGIRAVVVQDQVIGAQHTGDGVHGLLDLAADFAVGAFAHDVAHGVEQHFESGFEDEDRNHRADPAVQVEPEEHVQKCADQR